MTLMTSKEARRKWCPHARVFGTPGSDAAGMTWNRVPGEDTPASSACCIAGDCMAWQWGVMREERGDQLEIVNNGGGQFTAATATIRTPQGHCRLMGSPT